MLSIYSNLSSVDAQVRLSHTQDAVNKNMSHLASGLRIATAADDPAGLGISTQFDTQVRSYNQATRNVNDGISLMQTADGALGQIQGALQRMRELAVQSANGTLASADRVNIQTEFAQLQTEITRIASSTKFGNVQILNAASAVNIQVGVNATASDSIAVNFNAEDATTLKVDTASIKVDTAAGATASLANIDTAISQLSQDRASVGAAQNRLSVAMQNDQSFSENLGAAVSRMRDVDVASESAALARNQVLLQAGISVLAQANQSPNQALALLPH